MYRLSPNEPDLANILADLEGYAKTESIVHLMMESIPTLEGLVLTTWDEHVEQFVRGYVNERGWPGTLLRHDRRLEVWPYPEGGFVVNAKDIARVVQSYLADGRIVLLLEPYSPYDNGYNVSLLFNPDDTIVLEVAGPGFDASDLQRGRISPHEILRTDKRALRDWNTNSTGKVRDYFQTLSVIDPADYDRSVTSRLEKVAQKLNNRGEIFGMRPSKRKVSTAKVQQLLLTGGFDMLDRHKQKYTPIPSSKLEILVPFLLKIPSHLSRRWAYEQPYVVASSFVQKGSRLVFWDVVRPRLKYRSLLYRK